MKKAIQITLLLVYAAVGASQTKHPAQGSAVTIEVTDEFGAVIPKALVVLHADALERDNPKSFNLELRTSSEGEAKAVLPSFSMLSLLRRDSRLTARN